MTSLPNRAKINDAKYVAVRPALGPVIVHKLNAPKAEQSKERR
jgi:hypothetical protein